MSGFTIHAVALLLHAFALIFGMAFGAGVGKRPEKPTDFTGLFALSVILALAGYSLQVAA